MRLLELLASAACLTTAVAAVPTARGTQQGYSIAQNERTVVGGRNGAMAYRKTLRKFGGEIPGDVNDAAERFHTTKAALVEAAATSGSATAPQEQYDKEYLTPVTVGDSTMNLDIDTGSSDLWVFSDLLSSAVQRGHDVYKTKSAAFTGTRAEGSTWQITYGDNSGATGIVYTDKVTVAGVTAQQQAVEAATMVTQALAVDRNNDGIFGFGFSSINNVRPKPVLTWFDNVKSSLAAPVFAAALKHNAPGYYDFGYLNSSRYTGSIAYRPVDTSNGFWEIHCGGYYVGDTKYSQGPGTYDIIADTGTSLILVSYDTVQNYYSQVQSASVSQFDGGIVFNCNEQLPDFSLIVDGQKRTVPGSFINYAPAAIPGTCFGGIQPAGDIPFGVIGDVFLKSQYVVFDASKPQLGFAQAA